jgi:hypothetical protein
LLTHANCSILLTHATFSRLLTHVTCMRSELWDVRCSQRYCWILKCSWMWRCVVGQYCLRLQGQAGSSWTFLTLTAKAILLFRTSGVPRLTMQVTLQKTRVYEVKEVKHVLTLRLRCKSAPLGGWCCSWYSGTVAFNLPAVPYLMHFQVSLEVNQVLVLLLVLLLCTL